MIPNEPPKPRFFYLSIFFTAFTGIAFQITLIRSFSFTQYYHFIFLIISLALMGFGTSGTLLHFTEKKLKKNFPSRYFRIYLLYLILLPSGYFFAQNLELDFQYLLYNVGQPLLLLLFILLLFIPFLTGAYLLGAVTVLYPGKIKKIYGANLCGSGFGGVTVLFIFYLFSPEETPFKILIFPLAGSFAWLIAFNLISLKKTANLLLTAAGLAFTLLLLFYSPQIKPDRYKTLHYLRQLEAQGSAKKLITTYSPAARNDIYSADSFHVTLFAGLTAPKAPPGQLLLLTDGELSGITFKIETTDKAKILTHTPQSLAYHLTDSPDLLLLDDPGGTNIWLGKLFNARSITNVTNSREFITILKNELAPSGGNILNAPEVTNYLMPPRLFIDQSRKQYDLIQFCFAQGLPAASGGLYSLYEDYLLTIESLVKSYSLLKPGGFLTITRGIQTPPRDNIKIIATVIEALKKAGTERPEKHLFIGRNYLAVTTIVSKNPFTASQIEKLKTKSEELMMDTEYYPEINPEAMVQTNKIPGPAGVPYSYYHLAVTELLKGRDFNRTWSHNIKPAVDDNPYFHNFFKWESLSRLIEGYGNFWFRRVESGYIMVIAALAGVILWGLLLILLPLFLTKKTPKKGLLYFAFVGTAFMFVEIFLIRKMIRYLEHPVYSAACVIGAMLLFAGLGSLFQSKYSPSPLKRIKLARWLLPLLLLLYLVLPEFIMKFFITAPFLFRFFLAALLILPPAFLMGWFFSSGIERLEQKNPKAIPFAWAVNGFTSVTASPLALLLSISFNFSLLLIAGVFLYLGAGILFCRKPG